MVNKICAVTKFQEMFAEGKQPRTSDDTNSLYSTWNKFHVESQEFMQKTKNRKPIVDFKVRDDVFKQFSR